MLTFNDLGRYGRLGNQMFQIASTIGIATRHGYEFGFPQWKNYDAKERFNTKEDIDVQQYFKNKLPLCEKKDRVHFVDWGYHHLNLEDNISLAGHLQSEKYFLHCKELVRHYFEFKENPQIIGLPQNYCSVHVRLGDYDDNYHPRLGLEYYEPAMEIMAEKVIRFFVFSDDPAKASQLFRNTRLRRYIVIMEKNTTIQDFKFMSGFQNHIIGNSTFSWWTAWLSNCHPENVIAPRNWFGKIANLSSEDIYCEGWNII